RQYHGGDTAAIMTEVQAKRNRLREQETEHVAHMQNLALIEGWARFLGPKQLAVQLSDGGSQHLTAENIVVATGSRPRLLTISGLPTERTLTNENLFELPAAPRHLAIIGSGVIAMEMAAAFRKLGSCVTVVTRGERMLTSAVPEASEALHAAFTAKGIRVLYHASPTGYDAASASLHVRTASGAEVLHEVDYVLLAVGRERNLNGLGLENTGVAFDEKGIRINSFGQTSVPGLFAIGDVTPTSHYTHSANAQGRRVVQRIAFPLLPATGPEPFYPSAIFSDPEVASVGLTPAEIGAKYHPALVKQLRVELKDLDRGYTDDVGPGFMQVTALRLTGQILGVTIVGPRASEMISFFTLAISQRISLYKLYRLVYPYPTYSGAIQKIADAWMRETLPNLKNEVLAFVRYRFARPVAQAKPAFNREGREGREGKMVGG
nr:NAD(P)/FAD-dependent oxidoreductase [Chloroflexaceae bacterium]